MRHSDIKNCIMQYKIKLVLEVLQCLLLEKFAAFVITKITIT